MDLSFAGWAVLGVGCIAGGLAWGWRRELRGPGGQGSQAGRAGQAVPAAQAGPGSQAGQVRAAAVFDAEAEQARTRGRPEPPAPAAGSEPAGGPGPVASRLDAGTLARNTSVMAVGTVLSRLTGLLRVLALAFVLGGGRLADSFNLANNTPNMIYDLVAGGVLSASVVPVFVEWLSNRDDEDAGEAISAVLSTALAVLLVGTLLTAAAAPAIIALYNVLNHTVSRGDEQRLATELLWLFAPQVLFYGIATLAEGVLTARRRFGPPKFVPVLNNLVAIAVLLGIRQLMSSRDPSVFLHHPAWVALLGLGTTAGVALQALWLLPYLRDGAGRLRFVWQPRHPAVAQVIRLAQWAFGWVVANQVALIFVTVLANGHSGGYTAYSYAYIFFQLPYAVVAVSLITAFLPELSQAWSSGDHLSFGRQTGRGLRITAVVVVPAAAAMFVLARPGLELVLDYGGFRTAAGLTADVLAMFALGLPGFCAYAFLIRTFSSMQDTRTPFYLYLVENGLNILFAIPLYSAYGVRGLAASLALAYTAAAIISVVVLRRRTGELEPGLGLAHLRLVAAGVLAIVAMAVVVQLVPDRGVANRLADVVAGGVAGVTVFSVAAQAMGATELEALFARLRRSS